MKIINILHHVPPSGMETRDVMLDGWHAKFGQQIKRFYPKIEIECWLPTNAGGSYLEKDGIIFRTFRAVQPEFHTTVSLSILKELRKVERKDTLIHIFGERSTLTYSVLAMNRFGLKFPIILHHLGAGGNRGHPLGKMVSTAFSNLEGLILPRADLIYTVSKWRLAEMVDFGIPKDKLRLFEWGVNLDLFKPLDVSLSRKKLGLPLEAKIILCVSRFSPLRGLDLIINSMDRLGTKGVELVAVGGLPGDPLLPLVKKKLRHYRYRLQAQEVASYYQASDTFVWFVDSDICKFGGFGVSPQEAMACGTPVVSNTLVNAREAISPNIGLIPRNVSEFVRDIDSALTISDKEPIRSYAVRNFDWRKIAGATIQDYEHVLANHRNL